MVGPASEESPVAGLPSPPERLLTPAQVAAIVFVDPKTVSRWARAGKLPSTCTSGGHRRFRSSDVEALLQVDRVPEQRNAAPARAAAGALVAEAVALALEAQADAAAEAVTERAAAVLVAAAAATAAAAKARDARAAATAEAALAHALVRGGV